MKKQLLLVTLLFLINCSLQAQFQNGLWTGKEAYNWPGYDLGLNFSTSPLQLVDGGPNEFFEGYGAISDSAGNLLFYSDGVTVWNKNHEVMDNGQGLLGEISSTQSGLIIPKPGNEGLYYVFSTNNGEQQIYDPNAPSSGYYYSEIDMNLNGGLGAVTSNKNILLAAPSGEKITAVYHADGEQIWLLTHAGNAWGNDGPSNFFKAFLVSASGVSTIPVVSAAGEAIWQSYGQMKASPDGKRVAFINVLFFDPLLEVFDFDSATGQLSNPINLSLAVQFGWMGYGVEFSPNSRFLYVGETMPGKLRQYDLESDNAEQILASETVLADFGEEEMGVNRMSAIQAGPNGKIYLVFNNNLVEIGYPNNPGIACGVNLQGIGDLQGVKIERGAGLPGFIQDYFESGILYEGGTCSGAEIAFSTLRIPGITSISWDFGDTASSTNTSTDLLPTHTYNTAGTYTVTATITSNGAIQTATTEVVINPLPVVLVPGDGLSQCTDSYGNTTFDLTAFNSDILNGQNPELFTITYYSNEQDIATDNPIDNPQNFSTPGQTVFAMVANNETGCSVQLSFVLIASKLPLANVPLNIAKCSDTTSAIFDLTQQDVLILQGQNSDGLAVAYFDDMADIESNNPISQPSAFTSTGQLVYAIVINTLTGCSSAVVSFEISVPQPSVSGEILMMEGCVPYDLIEIGNKLGQGQILSFYTSEQNAIEKLNAIANASKYVPQNEESIFVRAEDAEGCAAIYGLTLQKLGCEIPKGISPNGDGKNDSFDLSSFDVSELKIFNRYGKIVFSKKNYSDEWHGQSDNGNDLPDATYYYMLQLNNGESKTGWVYVIRKS
ncbi:T9SS type B sorting domain-containing protein [Flavobacterium cerinum]|uniref:T9SS type B sorting domain-containing protein n=1 Tax=Flavobacterium cerinum TaxID=2502784 RepID=A0A3S3R0X1_9FLAO|nr:gliding motility-associated C-terminal domain-containing protein [Flavobacterium cerinum]RWX01373.1 T9SS type B sorting domain-containing protein [Flavobacterium cerinum]